MTTVKTYFKDMAYSEIKAIIEGNYKVECKLREIADEAFTYWDEQDFFRHSPRAVNDYGHGYLYSLGINPYASFSEQFEALDWLEEVHKEHWLGEDAPEKIKRARRYLEVMREDCYSITVKEKDYTFMENAVTEIFADLLEYADDYVNGLRNQFDDIDYMLDALLGNEMLDDFYIDECNNVWAERPDECVG